MIVAGTSGIVQPAASLPFMAKKAGAVIIEVNVDITPISSIADLFLQGKCGEVLPGLVD
jgi:NAD-dependent deacetylase